MCECDMNEITAFGGPAGRDASPSCGSSQNKLTHDVRVDCAPRTMVGGALFRWSGVEVDCESGWTGLARVLMNAVHARPGTGCMRGQTAVTCSRCRKNGAQIATGSRGRWTLRLSRPSSRPRCLAGNPSESDLDRSGLALSPESRCKGDEGCGFVFERSSDRTPQPLGDLHFA